MKRMQRLRSRKWLILPPVVLGLAVVVFLILNRRGPERKREQERSRVLRVIRVPVVDVVPRILAYGTAQPGQIWRAVAEVEGRVAEIHPQLKPGATIKSGETLLCIDRAEYELAVARLEADIARVEAQLDELVVKEANDHASLEIEEASLTLADRELHRAETLLPQKAVAEAEVDETQRNVLAQRQVVQRLKNSLTLIPSQSKSLEALLAAKKAGLAQAQLDLDKTIVKAPFDCRLGNLTVEVGQFLTVNEFLFEAHSTALTEVEAQIPLNQLRNIVQPGIRLQGTVNLDSHTVKRLFDFDVLVRYRSGDFVAEWKGRVARIREQIDTRTHTIGFVVAVDKPYDKVIPGERPPLVKGMYCEIELGGARRAGRAVIPRSAVHGGYVYLVNSENRLERRKVEVSFAQSGFVCLRSGLAEGDTLVVSDPTPAIEGLLASPVTDDRLLEKLVAEATARGSLK